MMTSIGLIWELEEDTLSSLTNKCVLTIGNMVFKQDIGIPMGIDAALFSVNLFLYFFESKSIKQLISSRSLKGYKCYGVFRSIDDLCDINDGNEFLTSFKSICPKELEPKVEHKGKPCLIFRS